MSEYDIERNKKDLEKSIDVLEVEFQEPVTDKLKVLVNSNFDEQQLKIMDLHYKMKLRQAIKTENIKNYIRYNQYYGIFQYYGRI